MIKDTPDKKQVQFSSKGNLSRSFLFFWGGHQFPQFPLRGCFGLFFFVTSFVVSIRLI